MSPAYLAYVQGVRELHRLAVAGLDESPEADAVRDATDLPWESLTEIEKKRVSGLSEDLYSISEPGSSDACERNPETRANLHDFYEARNRGDWDQALEILRRRVDELTPSLVSRLRATVWTEAGDHASASLFHEHAMQLESDGAASDEAHARPLDTRTPEDTRRLAERG